MEAIDYQVVKEAPVEAIVDLYRAGGWWDGSEAWRAAIPRMIEGSFCFMVARNPSGRIVGMARALSDGVSDAYIQDVVVLEEYRKRSIGRELIRRLTAFCVERKIGWVGLVAEPGTQAFYESLGYQPLVGYQPMLFMRKGG